MYNRTLASAYTVVRHTLKPSRQDEIWNRACLDAGGSSPAVGDQALASLLVAHGLAMNGGVVHAMECLSQSELAAAIAGFNYFGITGASLVFEQQPDDSEATEERLDQMYWAAVPDEEALVHAFRVRLMSTPEAFAPTDPGAHT